MMTPKPKYLEAKVKTSYLVATILRNLDYPNTVTQAKFPVRTWPSYADSKAQTLGLDQQHSARLGLLAFKRFYYCKGQRQAVDHRATLAPPPIQLLIPLRCSLPPLNFQLHNSAT